MVGDDFKGSAIEVVAPGLEAFSDGKEFFVGGVIVSLGSV